MSDKSVLVTGGAGYIGSHAVMALASAGWRPVVLDNLSTGFVDLVTGGVPFVEGDAGDGNLVRHTIAEHGCTGVLHFAGSVEVAESVRDPLKYYRNNTDVTGALLAACLDAGIERFVYSSTAAVYGDDQDGLVDESAPTNPANPYGRSKLAAEWLLRDAAAGNLKLAVLRYFNVAGADPEGRSGQVSAKGTSLIKRVARAVAGKDKALTIFGDDYDTPDGTCVRDYIHVSDLADVHVAALRHLEKGDGFIANCGYGQGYSVRQVIDTAATVADQPLKVEQGPRRDGDVATMIADVGRLKKLLSWQPHHDNLEDIIRSAVNWEKSGRAL